MAAVVTKRTPVAPKGWPKERDPPHKLNLSKGGAPGWVYIIKQAQLELYHMNVTLDTLIKVSKDTENTTLTKLKPKQKIKYRKKYKPERN